MAEYTTTVSVTPDEAACILAKHFAKKLNLQDCAVKFNLEAVTSGYGPGERTTRELTAIEVTGKMLTSDDND